MKNLPEVLGQPQSSGLIVKDLKVRGLKPVSFAATPGECIAVQGPSGSGKTLLLRALADLDPAEGEVQLHGLPRHRLSGPEWRRRVRYLAAEPGWWEATPRPHFRDAASAARRAAAAGLDASVLDRPIAQLSTGERQRLALIRALEDEPAVLLLDEPTAALDPHAEKAAEILIKSELRRGAIVILVTHKPAQITKLASRRLVIEDGEARMEPI